MKQIYSVDHLSYYLKQNKTLAMKKNASVNKLISILLFFFTVVGFGQATPANPSPVIKLTEVIPVDANGARPVTINQPLTAITSTPQIVDAEDYNSATGSNIITISGGTGPYKLTYKKTSDSEYSADIDSDSSSKVYLSNLTNGKYEFTIKDKNGCSLPTTGSFTIGVFKVTIVLEPIKCFGDLTTLKAQITNDPVVNYTSTYLWSDKSTSSSTTGGIINNGGSYSVTVTQNGINRTDNLNLTNLNQPTKLTCTTSSTPIKCNNTKTGTITLTPSGGTKPYSYQFYDSARNKIGDKSGNIAIADNSVSVEGFPAGSYNVIITDENDCIWDNTTQYPIAIKINVDDIDPLSVSLRSQDPPSSKNASDGSIQISAFGGSENYNYTWTKLNDPSFVSTNSASVNNLTEGLYEVIVSDQNGGNCSVSISIKLQTLSVAVSIENNKCNGNSQGKLVAVASGGKLINGNQYSYKWYKDAIVLDSELNSDLSNGVISGHKEGDYIVVVSDGITSISSVIKQLIDPLALNASVTTTNVSCHGTATGEIKIVSTGGTIDTSGYQYTWSKVGILSNNGATNSNLTAGVYTVTVTDSNGCSLPLADIKISNENDLITIEASTIKEVSIYGKNDGAIKLAATTGGSGAYTYSWTYDKDPAFKSTAKDISNLFYGRYTVTVTDSYGCPVSKYFDITQRDELKVDLKETASIYCFGTHTGALKAEVTGGFGLYKFQWFKNNEVVPFSDKMTVEEQYAGNYKVVVTDTANPDGPYATATAIYTLTEIPKLIVSLTEQTNVLCHGEWTGAIDINVIGGTKNYDFKWQKEGVPFATTEDLSLLEAGTYVVTVTDSHGCFDNLSVTLIEPEKSLAIKNETVTHLSGYQTKNGSISVTIEGGTPNYTYLWENTATNAGIGNTPEVKIETIGTYKLTVTDDHDCIFIKEYKITEPEELIISNLVESNTNKCFNDNTATITSTVIGGVIHYTYYWTKSGDATFSSSEASPSTLYAGTYNLIVVDANGNTTNKTLEIKQPDELIVVPTVTDAKCYGGNSGGISLTISGGTGKYTIVWTNGKNKDNLVNNLLVAGTYGYTVTDENFCVKSDNNILVREPADYFISNINKTSLLSVGIDQASIEVSVQGGTAPYKFEWLDATRNSVKVDNNADNKATLILDNIQVGKYYVLITDNNGCVIDRDLDKEDPLSAVLTQINTNLCHGDLTASIKATAYGGAHNYYYKWYTTANPTVEIPVLDRENNTLSGVGIGSYYVVAYDSFGKSIQSEAITIGEPDQLTLDLKADYTLCGEQKDWEITSTVTGGTLQPSSSYAYYWNGIKGNKDLKQASPGKYALKVIDDNNCSIEGSIELLKPKRMALELKKIDPTCFEGSDASITTIITNGTAPYTYEWSTGEKTVAIANLTAGEYKLTLKDSRGCTAVQTIVIENPVKGTIDLGPDVTLCIDQTYTINATISDTKASYKWSSDKGFSSTNPIVTITQAANYQLEITTGLGCLIQDDISIHFENAAIDAVFAISSQVFVNESFVIVDISNPKADSIQWILPASAKVTSKNTDLAEMSFDTAGEYEITLLTKKGNCTASQTKKVLVVTGEYKDPDSMDLQKKFDMTIYPNPSTGKFTVAVTLDKVMPASIKIYNLLNNTIVDSKSEVGKDNYSFNFNLNGLTAGVYFVLFESQQGTKLRKIIIN
ncbi:MAG: T9SS type A sorting domain-containing protein [Flavobacterium sp.]|nr:T9SS type A sorting domain-containing protein [Flavobacterium sp.]